MFLFFLYIKNGFKNYKKTWENNGIEVIVDSVNALWLNEKNIEKKLSHKSLSAITNKFDKIYKKYRCDLENKPIKQSNRRFVHIDLALKIIMDCKTDKSCRFFKKIEFKLYDVINTKEQTIINSKKDTFERENMQTHYSVLGYRIDLYFHEYKLAIEVDELGHTNRNINNETETQKALEKELNCVFIRINPDEKDFNIFKEINKIQRRIKKLFKKLLIDKILKNLLKLKFKSNHLITTKTLKRVVKNILPNYKK